MPLMATQRIHCLATATLLISTSLLRESAAQGGSTPSPESSQDDHRRSQGQVLTPAQWQKECTYEQEVFLGLNRTWTSPTGKMAYESYSTSIDSIEKPYCYLVEVWPEFSDWCKQQIFPGRPFQMCVAEAGPFVTRRPSNHTVESSRECQLSLSDWAEETPDLARDPRTMTLAEFHANYTGFEVEMVMGLLHESLNDPRARVHLYSSQLAALYAMKKGKCSVLAAGLAMQTKYAAVKNSANCTARKKLSCDDPDDEDALDDKHICDISYIDIPTYSSGYAVLTKVNYVKSAFTQIMENFQAPAVVNMFSIASLGVIAVSHVMWILERDWEPSTGVFAGYRQGVEEGMWWAMTTMTTVGYGDIVPYTLAGRLVAVSWMIAGMLLFSFFSAVLTSALVVDRAPQYLRFSSYDDIAAHLNTEPESKFCTVESSYVSNRVIERLTEFGKQGSVVVAGSLEACYSELASEYSEVVGVIADRPSLLYDGNTRLRPNSQAPLQDDSCFEHGVVVGGALEEVPYALAVRSRYSTDSGMSHMEECCRIAWLQSFAHELVFNAVNNGLMFGSFGSSSGFLQSIRQLQRHWFGESDAIFKEIPLGHSTSSGDEINIPLLCTTIALYAFAVVAFSVGRYRDARRMKEKVISRMKSTMSTGAGAVSNMSHGKHLTIRPPSPPSLDELPRALTSNRARANRHHMARLGTHLAVASFRADSARFDGEGFPASPGHVAWRDRDLNVTADGQLLPHGAVSASTAAGSNGRPSRVSFA